GASAAGAERRHGGPVEDEGHRHGEIRDDRRHLVRALPVREHRRGQSRARGRVRRDRHGLHGSGGPGLVGDALHRGVAALEQSGSRAACPRGLLSAQDHDAGGRGRQERGVRGDAGGPPAPRCRSVPAAAGIHEADPPGDAGGEAVGLKIAVCIKRVPDSETRVKIATDGKSLDEAGVKFVLNPYDEFAVEEALRRKEQAGSGEVVVVCLGPAAAQETIRTAPAMGADRGVLLQADKIPPDGFEVAKALAAELKDGGWDLILCGKMAIDDYNHQVGPMVAELLGLPCVTAAAHLTLEAGKGTAEREIEGGVEVVEFPLPAVITADKGLNEPRYPALKGIMAAKKKPLDVKPVTLSGSGLEVLALLPPPERKEGRIV